jgi:hypothetical protein
MCWYPGFALDPRVRWKAEGPRAASAELERGGLRAGGTFHFGPGAEPLAFEARRPMDRKGGATEETWRVDLDPESYTEMDGTRVPLRSVITWKLKEGDFPWLKLELTGLKLD